MTFSHIMISFSIPASRAGTFTIIPLTSFPLALTLFAKITLFSSTCRIASFRGSSLLGPWTAESLVTITFAGNTVTFFIVSWWGGSSHSGNGWRGRSRNGSRNRWWRIHTWSSNRWGNGICDTSATIAACFVRCAHTTVPQVSITWTSWLVIGFVPLTTISICIDPTF